jgi:hypothetical protein
MRIFRIVLSLGLPLVAGCAGNQVAFSPLPDSPLPAQRPGTVSTGIPSPGRPLIVTPEKLLVGKVARVNSDAGFVVLNFPPGHMPALAQNLALYRNGLRVGEVRITGPQNDDDVVADLVIGDAEVRDEVRDK